MMTKTSNNKKSSTMARVALGATAALALAGRANATCLVSEYVKVTSSVGACVTCPAGTASPAVSNERANTASYCTDLAPGYYGTKGTVGASHATPTKCPTGSTSTPTTATDLALVGCVTKAGYYIQVASATATSIVLAQAPAGWYAAGGNAVTNGAAVNIAPSALVEATGITNTASAYSNAKIIPCRATYTNAQAGSVTSEVGSSAKTACKTVAGYFISTLLSAATDSNVITSKVPANYYAPAGELLSDTGATQTTACPFAGTTAGEGSTKQADCTPDCATTWPASGAVALAGSCVCAAGNQGGPRDIAGATTAAAYNQCTPCSKSFPSATAAGVTSTPGTSGASNCITAPGYHFTSTANIANAITLAQAPANSYHAGGSSLGSSTTIETPTQCPEHSTSAAGSNDISDCKCVAGYASTAKTCEPCAGEAAGTAVGTHTTCSSTAATSGASGVSVLAAISAVVAAQLVL